MCARRAGQRGGAGEEADLPDRHQGLPPVLRRGFPDQAGEQPDRARGRRAEQHHGATGAGRLPRGGSDQEDPRGAPGKAALVQLLSVHLAGCTRLETTELPGAHTAHHQWGFLTPEL